VGWRSTRWYAFTLGVASTHPPCPHSTLRTRQWLAGTDSLGPGQWRYLGSWNWSSSDAEGDPPDWMVSKPDTHVDRTGDREFAAA
jgi:hypothetical protein